jgi:CHAT domain-containing protein
LVLGQTRRARLEALAASDVCKEAVGSSHPEYARSLYRLGVLYRDHGDLTWAQVLHRQALAIREKEFGYKHIETLASRIEMGLCLLLQDKWSDAEKWLPRLRGRWRAGEERPEVLAAAICLWARWERGAFPSALGDLADAFHRRSSVRGNARRQESLQQWRGALDLALGVTPTRDVYVRNQYEAVLEWRDANASRGYLATNRLNPDQLALLGKHQRARAELDVLDDLPQTGEQEERMARAEERLGKPAERRSLYLADGLPHKVALVDYVMYTDNPLQIGGGKKDRWLLAFVYRGRWQTPVVVKLGAAAPIEAAATAWRQSLASARPGAVNEKLARLLHERLLAPLGEHVKDALTLLIAADGELANLPFAALPGFQPRTWLIEEFAVANISADHPLQNGPAPPPVSTSGFVGVADLDPGRRLQLERLARQYRRAFPKRTAPRLLFGKEADRAGFVRALAPIKDKPGGKAQTPRYVHLGVPGFFLPVVRHESAAFGESMYHPMGWPPMWSSGLMLSGGAANREEGQLAAAEIADLDLRGCDLVVLNGCEPGVSGELSALLRGFHEAGARTVVASLWNNSDPASSVLLERFYDNLWSKRLSKMEALRQAQLFVLNNPAAIIKRAKELALSASDKLALRGITDGNALLPVGATEKDKESHPAWWAGWTLSGDPFGK